jgi:hypothetical protein
VLFRSVPPAHTVVRGVDGSRLRRHSADSTLPPLWPTGSSSGWLPSIAARSFSSCPPDSTSRWTPCPPRRLPPRPARRYPRLRIWRPPSERQWDFNPPEHVAAQRTLWPDPTPPAPRRRSGLPRVRLPGPVPSRPGSMGASQVAADPVCSCRCHTPRRPPTVLALADGPVLPSTSVSVSAAAAMIISELAHIGPFTSCLRFATPVARRRTRLGPGLVASRWPVGTCTRWVRSTSFRKS